MSKIAVLGSSGFISGHLIQELHAQGYEVIGLTRHQGYPFYTPEDAKPDYTYIGDIKDAEVVDRVVALSNGVINLAGILGTQETVNNPMPSVEVNIVGALNVLEACRRNKTPLVQIAVGNFFEQNSYSITKTTAERFCIMYAKEHDLHVNVVRALNAFGERQSDFPVRKITPSFIKRAIKEQSVQVYGDGTQLMDMIYVKDVAKILIERLLCNEYGTLVEAGNGYGIQVKDYAKHIIEYSGSSSNIEYLPMRPGETPKVTVVAQNPYFFTYTDVFTALDKTIDWYKDNVQSSN
jgi:nucleoside-diphosphate-sugar epimerase